MKSKYSLLQYSISAAALLQGASAFSQSIYTDVDPDIVLDEPGEWWGFDLDGDGLNDFNFFNKSFTTTVFYMDQANVKAVFAGAFDTIQNGLAGNTFTLSGGYSYNRPYALDNNELVNNSLPFYNDNYQTLAKEIDKFDSPFSNTHLGNWYSFYGDITNHYLGFRFTDEENVQRYGWIRCSVIDSGRTLIIHDYAYENKPDTPILTGDTIGDTTTVSISYVNSINAIVYSYEKNIFVLLNAYSNAILTVNNLQGHTIMKQELHQSKTEINMEGFPPGIYLVTVIAGDKHFTKKLFIN